MALKAVLPSLDGIDEQLHSLYAKGEDGSYYLDIEDIKPHPSTRPLANTLEKYKRDMKQLQETVKKFDGIDIEKYNELLEAEESGKSKKEGGENQAVADKLKERLTAQFQAEIGKKDEILSKKEAAIRKLVLDNALSAAIEKAGVKAEYRTAVKAMMRERQLDVSEDGDDYIGVFKTDLGDVPIAEYINTWSQSDEASHYLPADRKSGSGAPSGGNRSGGSVATFDRNDPLAWGQNLDKLAKGEAKAA